jgi:hypothetical protein
MLTAHGSTDITALKRMARSIELQAGRASPSLARQLRSLAARYYAEAEALCIGPISAAADATRRGPRGPAHVMH